MGLPRATGVTGALPAAVIIGESEAVTSILRPHKCGWREPMDCIAEFLRCGSSSRCAAARRATGTGSAWPQRRSVELGAGR